MEAAAGSSGSARRGAHGGAAAVGGTPWTLPCVDPVALGHREEAAHREPRYHIRKKDLGQIHQAASAGDVAKVEQILSLKKKVLDARDRKKRTALHLACANGHPEVVTVLVDRKCKLNVPDSEKRTALIKAVQCLEEECATILLEHGANPNHSDVYGNTALHYAVYGDTPSIAAKLLSHGANKEAINKDHLTPLLLAVSGTKEEMVEFLIQKNADINAVDKMNRTALMLAEHHNSPSILHLLEEGMDVFSEDISGRTVKDYGTTSGFNTIHHQISEYKEEKIPDDLSENSNPVDGISEDSTIRNLCCIRLKIKSLKTAMESSRRRTWNQEPIRRMSTYPTIDDLSSVDTKDVSEPNLTNLTTASQQSRKYLEAKYATVRTGKGNVFEDKISDHPKEDVFECFPTTSGKVQGFLNPSFPPPEPQRKPSSGSLENCGLTKEGATKPASGQKENGIGIIEHAPREQKVMSILFMCTKITEVVS
ncbi:ankyrin repeat domain-containing protein 26-like [Lemur catta]|uniref:ankyrin repeat domain-containing protein 26-like n=1 Tax=Lemur catta TaxID=9447 RepID=UPI001E26B57B|nr:ankyrin repeat domain-containing protein 26-like [Lemur catta]